MCIRGPSWQLKNWTDILLAWCQHDRMTKHATAYINVQPDQLYLQNLVLQYGSLLILWPFLTFHICYHSVSLFQVHHKSQTLPSHMHHPVYMSHDDITQSPARTAYERSRSLTPDPIRSANYAQNPIYGRMGISPERPPPPQERVAPPDRPLILRTIPENNLMLNGLKNGGDYYDYMDGYGRPLPVALSPRQGQRPYPRQAMSPPAVPSAPKVEPTRRAFSPPPNLQNYDYIQVNSWHNAIV